MARDYVSVEIADTPNLQRLANAVRESGRPHALIQGEEIVAIVRAASKKARTAGPRRRSVRRGVFTMDDPLWTIVGMFEDPDGPTDVSANKHKYLAEASMPKQPLE